MELVSQKKISLKVLLFNFKDHRLIIISNYLCLFFVSVMSLVSYVAFNGRHHRQNVCLTIESMYAIPFVRSIHVSRISDECLDSKFGVKLNSPKMMAGFVGHWMDVPKCCDRRWKSYSSYFCVESRQRQLRAIQLCEWAPSISGCRGDDALCCCLKGI